MKIIKSKTDCKQLVKQILSDEQFEVHGLDDNNDIFFRNKFWYRASGKGMIINSYIYNNATPMSPAILTPGEACKEIWERRKEINNYTRKFDDEYKAMQENRGN